MRDFLGVFVITGIIALILSGSLKFIAVDDQRIEAEKECHKLGGVALHVNRGLDVACLKREAVIFVGSKND